MDPKQPNRAVTGVFFFSPFIHCLSAKVYRQFYNKEMEGEPKSHFWATLFGAQQLSVKVLSIVI